MRWKDEALFLSREGRIPEERVPARRCSWPLSLAVLLKSSLVRERPPLSLLFLLSSSFSCCPFLSSRSLLTLSFAPLSGFVSCSSIAPYFFARFLFFHSFSLFLVFSLRRFFFRPPPSFSTYSSRPLSLSLASPFPSSPPPALIAPCLSSLSVFFIFSLSFRLPYCSPRVYLALSVSLWPPRHVGPFAHSLFLSLSSTARKRVSLVVFLLLPFLPRALLYLASLFAGLFSPLLSLPLLFFYIYIFTFFSIHAARGPAVFRHSQFLPYLSSLSLVVSPYSLSSFSRLLLLLPRVSPLPPSFFNFCLARARPLNVYMYTTVCIFHLLNGPALSGRLFFSREIYATRRYEIVYSFCRLCRRALIN